MKRFYNLLFALLAVLPAIAQDVTEAPTIEVNESRNEYTIDVEGAGLLTVELYRDIFAGEGENPELFESAQVSGSYHYVISRPYEMEGGFQCIVKARAQENDMLPSEEVIKSFDVRPFFIMPTPVISFNEDEDGLYIDVQGEGNLTVYITVNGESVDVDQLPFFVPRTYEEQEIYVNAIADGYGELDVLPAGATASYVLAAAEVPPEPLVTPTPHIWVEEKDDYVIIHADDTHNPYDPNDPFGEVAVYLYIDGQQVDNPYVVHRTYDLQDLGVSAYAVSLTNQDVLPSETAYIVCLVEPLPQPEQTSAPTINLTSIENGCYVVTLCETEPSTIYYRVGVYDEVSQEFEFGLWVKYQDELTFMDPGIYRIEAYAIAVGKVESVIISGEFVCILPTPSYIYDFVEDGVFYKITTEGKVSVCSETTDFNSYSGEVTIPATVTHGGVTYMVTGIKEDAFRGCSGLTGVTIGAYVTAIGDRAFKGCSSLTSVTLGDYVITVGANAFSGCSSLASVTLGSGVAQIGSGAFSSCNALTSVTCKAATPPVMAGSDCFGCYDTATLHVYPPVLDSYKAADGWKLFANIIAEDKVAPAACDTNGDGKINISDVTSLINYLLNMP